VTLRYLVFDYSEDADDGGSFDAMASVLAPQVAEVEAEIEKVLAWANAQFPGMQGPVEEGGEWDIDLQVTSENDAAPRQTYSLVMAGTPAFCEAFQIKFGSAVA
jgi:hypothetical protein